MQIVYLGILSVSEGMLYHHLFDLVGWSVPHFQEYQKQTQDGGYPSNDIYWIPQ